MFQGIRKSLTNEINVDEEPSKNFIRAREYYKRVSKKVVIPEVFPISHRPCQVHGVYQRRKNYQRVPGRP